MGTDEKLLRRFLRQPNDFTFQELERLLRMFGYQPLNKGRTSSSRIIFKSRHGKPIMLHKPHPGNIVKEYAMKQILRYLKEDGLLNIK